MVLFTHFEHAVPAVLERLECRFLRNDRGTEHRILVHLHHRIDQGCWTARVTNPPARHRKGLRKTMQKNRAFSHAGKARDARVRSLKRELGVNLITHHQ